MDIDSLEATDLWPLFFWTVIISIIGIAASVVSMVLARRDRAESPVTIDWTEAHDYEPAGATDVDLPGDSEGDSSR